MSDDTLYWVRWVVVLCFAFTIVPVLLGLRLWSISRVRRGNRALTGTTWMLPPNYREATRNEDDISVVAPPYRHSVGDDDLGYYDENGVFISKPEPAAVTRVVSRPSLDLDNDPVPLSRAPSYNWRSDPERREPSNTNQVQDGEGWTAPPEAAAARRPAARN